jgi:hypothetical protein
MKIIITPEYKDIYNDNDIPKIEEIIAKLPKVLFIQFLAFLNAKLYNSQIDKYTQSKILKIILKRNSNELEQISNIIYTSRMSNPNQEIQIFTSHANLEFLHLLIIHGNEDTSYEDSSPENELNFFKAYLLVNSRINEYKFINETSEFKSENLREINWTVFKDQFLLNQPLKYFTSLIKAKCLFDVLINDSFYNKYAKQFIEEIGDPNSLTYLMRFVHLIQYNQAEENKVKFMINSNPSTERFLNLLAFDIEQYKTLFSLNHNSFKGFKNKPLLKLGDKFIVLDWNIFSGKIYHGFIFDIFNHSDLKKTMDFLEYKKFIGEKIIEEYVFRKIINTIFDRKNYSIRFDEKNKDSLPDALIQWGRELFIFEIKDASFSSNALSSEDPQKIKKEIDIKYNNSKKGTGQIASFLEKILNTKYSTEILNNNIKTRNLQIYPVIIYTDPYFGLPGIMNYIQGEFKNLIEQKQLNNKFKKILPCAFIHIDFFIENIDRLRNNEFQFNTLIEHVEEENRRRKKRFMRTKQQPDYFNTLGSFEEIVKQKKMLKKSVDGDYIKAIYDVFEMGKNLD